MRHAAAHHDGWIKRHTWHGMGAFKLNPVITKVASADRRVQAPVLQQRSKCSHVTSALTVDFCV